jgi:branched-chain amino acid transport system ATP-binding protein
VGGESPFDELRAAAATVSPDGAVSTASRSWPGQPSSIEPRIGSDVVTGDNISLTFGGVKALRNVSFSVRKGELFSIIGPNGAGKTSLLNCISGRYRPSQGDLKFEGQSLISKGASQRAKLGIARTFQNLALFAHMTVLDNILVGRHHLMRSNFLSEGFYWWSGAAKEEAAHRQRVEELIEFLEIEHVRHAIAGSLSYGLRKRVELARAMAIEPRLLLLDEPMAGMNLEEKEDIARFVVELSRERGTTIIMIEHDMGVVMDISDRVLVLNYGEVIAQGVPSVVLSNPIVRQAYLGAEST